MQDFIARFIPATLAGNPELMRRARFVVMAAFTSCISAFVYGVQHLFLVPVFASSVTLWLVTLACLAVPFVLRGTGSVNMAGNLLVGAYWAAAAALMYFEGGLAQADVRFWMVGVPILATFMLGARTGLFWTIASFAVYLAFFALQMSGQVLTAPQAPAIHFEMQYLISACGLVLFMTVLARSAETAKNQALESLEAVRAEESKRRADDYRTLDDLKAASERRTADDLNRINGQREYMAQSVEALLLPVNRIAAGDFTASVNVGDNDEIQRLSNELSATISTIRTMIADVVNAIDTAAGAVDVISIATEKLAEGAEEQSNQVSQVSSAVEEMSRTIGENTKQTSLAAFEASEANMDAQRGGEVMEQLIENVQRVGAVVMDSAEKIARLGASSQQIGEIVSVIDEIADQTNLLALNAAIEAARAGEHGKGFSVVAGEVRQLAERTQKATKQISTMIKGIQLEMGRAVTGMNRGKGLVQQGEKLVAQTTEALNQIVNRTYNVAEVISRVALASEEQSSTSDEMAHNVTQMASAVEESTKGLTDIARSIEGVLRQAEELQVLIGQFNIGNAATSPTSRTLQASRRKALTASSASALTEAPQTTTSSTSRQLSA
jgi:methyl-accepting chemotaxis protein